VYTVQVRCEAGRAKYGRETQVEESSRTVPAVVRGAEVRWARRRASYVLARVLARARTREERVYVYVCVSACVTCVYDDDDDDDDGTTTTRRVLFRGAVHDSRESAAGSPEDRRRFNYARGIGGQVQEKELRLRLKRVHTEPARRMLPRPLPRHFGGEYDFLASFLARPEPCPDASAGFPSAAGRGA